MKKKQVKASTLMENKEVSLSEGPRQLNKLSFTKKMKNFKVSHENPTIMTCSLDNQLEQFHLKNTHAGCSVFLRKSFDIQCTPNDFLLCGGKAIHSEGNYIKINNRQEIIQPEKINHLLADHQGILVNSAKNEIYISNVQKAQVIGQLKGHCEQISSLFWQNSLLISGDTKGYTKLWAQDINKQAIIFQSKTHSEEVNKINCYVDYLQNNLYYTCSYLEKKMAFHDMRVNKCIGTISNLYSKNVVDIKHTSSGKILIAFQQFVDFIDLYKGFTINGNFSQVNSENAPKFIEEHPKEKIESRLLRNLLIYNKYAVLGCSNGCIEVYDTDLLTCLYSFGISQFTDIKRLEKIGKNIVALDGEGNTYAAIFA